MMGAAVKSCTTGTARPWRKAFRRVRALPALLRGPVLFCALRRLAAILASEVIRPIVDQREETFGAVSARSSVRLLSGLLGGARSCGRRLSSFDRLRWNERRLGFYAGKFGGRTDR
jgi:hypothetical protein